MELSLKKVAFESANWLSTEYLENERSIYSIAEQLGVYPNKVLRALKKFKIPLRNKSEAQSVALESGRHEHPQRINKMIRDGKRSSYKGRKHVGRKN